MNTLKFTIRAMVVGLIAVFAAKSEGQTLLQTTSNSVADGTLVMDGSRSDWNGLTAFNADPNEGSTQDWSVATIANDSSNFYFRYQFNATQGLDSNVMIFLDTDNSRSSGFTGSLPIGADFMIQGIFIYAYAGSGGTDFTWNNIGGVNYDTAVTNDFEFSMARSTIGAVTSFGLVYLAQGTIGVGGPAYDDYYPDSGNGGPTGGYLAYTTVPEPATNLLILGGLGMLVGSRRFLRHREA